MKHFLIIFVLSASSCFGQAWSNILASSRAIDWSHAGLPATLPDGETTPNPWTPPTRTKSGSTITCANTSADVGTINTALAAASAGTYVLVTGTCDITNTVVLYGINNVTLRGTGPQSALLNLSNSANSYVAMGEYPSTGSGTLASSYGAGTTSITITSTSGTPVVNALAYINQCDNGAGSSIAACTSTPVDNGSLFECGDNAVCDTDGTDASSFAHEQQSVLITNVVNNGGGSFTLTISPGLYMPDWSTSRGATVTFNNLSNQIIGIGLEDLTVYSATAAPIFLIQMTNSYASWLKGVKILGHGSAGFAMKMNQSKNGLIANNYALPEFLLTSYDTGISVDRSSDVLVLNNILHLSVNEYDGLMSGIVTGYNFARDGFTAYPEATWAFDHHPFSSFDLWEGNEWPISTEDNIWGTHALNTYFRNYTLGFDSPYLSGGYYGMDINGFQRFENFIGNVIGSSAITSYQAASTGSGAAWVIITSDSLVSSTLMRWGNVTNITQGSDCPSANSGVRFCSSEVPSSLSSPNTAWQNPVPSNTNLPCSFFLAGYTSTTCTPHANGGTGLSWWKVCKTWTTFPTSCSATQTQPFPTTGPDVTGGPAVNGYTYHNPAVIAWSYLPVDTTYQNSYTITASSWSGGTETLTVSSLPAQNYLLGPFQLSGASGSCVPAGTPYLTSNPNSEAFITTSTSTTVQYALTSNPGSNACTGTMLFPDVRQFDERVYESDPALLSQGVSLLGNIRFSGNGVLLAYQNTNGGPLTYGARTDMCAFAAGVDFINGASGSTCPAYSSVGAAQTLAFQGQGATNATTGVWTPGAGALTYLPNIAGYTGGGGSTHAGSALQCADSLGLNGCGGPGTGMVDLDFGSNIYRATDYNTWGSPGVGYGNTFGVGDNGQFRIWDLNSLALLINNAGGGISVASFSNDNNAYTIPSAVGGPPSTVWCGNNCTAFTSNEVAWSGNVVDRLWELDSRQPCCTGASCATTTHPECQLGATAPFNQLNRIDLSRTGPTPASWTFTRTPEINFTMGYTANTGTGNAVSCTTGLPSTFLVNWSGSMNVGKDENQFEFTFSDDGQGGIAKPSASPPKLGSIYTVAWKPGSGCIVLTGSPDANGFATYAGDWSTPPYSTSGEVKLGNASTTAVFYDTWYLHAGGIESNTAIAQFAPAPQNIINSPINPPTNMAISAASETGSSYVTFTTASLSSLLPSTWPVGAQVVIAGMTPGSSTSTPYNWDCPPNNIATGGTWPGCTILASPAPSATQFSVCVNSTGTGGCFKTGLATATGFGNASPGTACFGITTNNLCENYYWLAGTPFVDFTTLTGHSGKGTLYNYKGKLYTAYAAATPEIQLGNLLPSTEPYTPPTDQHLSYWNSGLSDLPPVLGFTTNVCGLGTSYPGVGSNNCGCAVGSNPASCPATPGAATTYADVCISNSVTQCPEVNEIMGAQNIVTNTGITICNILGGGTYPGGCIYRFAHNFASMTSWYFETQNAVGNVSPNGRWAAFSSDWFAGVGNWPLGCTNGTTGPCYDNITQNGNNNVQITAATVSGSGPYTLTFTTNSIAGYSPTTWPVGAPVIVATGMTPSGYSGTWTIVTGSATQFTVSSATSPGGPGTVFSTANLQCTAQNTSPCARGDVFIVDLESAH